MNPLANATLLEIRGPAAIDATGDPSGSGTLLWSGQAAGYLKRVRREKTTSGDEQQTRTDTFTILATALPSAVEVAGANWEATTVVINDQRATTPVERTFTVQGMENRAVGSTVDSVRLELSKETAS